MVVLADEILESFFETDFSSTFRLEPVPLEVPTSNPSVLGSLWSNIASDDNRKLLNIVTDQIGRTIGKHQVEVPYAGFDRVDTDSCAGVPPASHWQDHVIGRAQGSRIPAHADDAPLVITSELQPPGA